MVSGWGIQRRGQDPGHLTQGGGGGLDLGVLKSVSSKIIPSHPTVLPGIYCRAFNPHKKNKVRYQYLTSSILLFTILSRLLEVYSTGNSVMNRSDWSAGERMVRWFDGMDIAIPWWSAHPSVLLASLSCRPA